MGTFLRTYYLAERLKLKHLFSNHLIWIMPVLAVAGTAFFSPAYASINSYNWWYMYLLPGFTALMCCFTCQKDKKLKNRAVAILPVDLKKVWDAKVLVCMRAAALGSTILCLLVLLLVTLAERVFKVTMAVSISPISIILSALVIILLNMWQIPLCLWMAHKTGIYLTIFITLVMNVYGGAETALKSYWLVNPYALLSRVMCPMMKVLPNNLAAREGSFSFSPELLEAWTIPAGIIIGLMWFIALWMVTRRWYGRKGAETV